MKNHNNSCFFRTIPENNSKKALIQLTERCNLHCIHCFLSADKSGIDISLEDIKIIIPKLKELGIKKVTLTGGEPLLHKNIVEICENFINNNFKITICTNGILITDDLIFELAQLKNVKFNVSIDGFSKNSIEKFRGKKNIYEKLILNIKKLSSNNLLKGLITTPNVFSNWQEYVDLCYFAKNIGAKYVIVNPLSEFGRGIDTKSTYSHSPEIIKKIKDETSKLIDFNFSITYIRLNTDNSPLGKCCANNIFYILANGDIYNCPYLYFSSLNDNCIYNSNDFLLGNIISDNKFNTSSNVIDLFNNMNKNRNDKCKYCYLEKQCNFGCPAIILSSNQNLNGIDTSICPNSSNLKEK